MAAFKNLLYFLVFLLIATLLHQINQKVDSSAQLHASPTKKQTNHDRKESRIQAADPTQLGISITNEQRLPASPEAWTAEIEETMTGPDILQNMNQQDILDELKTNPEKLKERIQRIEEEIGQQQIRVRQHPTDVEEKNRLESLFMLRATLYALNHRISQDGSTKP